MSEAALSIAPYAESDRVAVVALWREVFAGDPPWNEPNAVIDAKVAQGDGLLLVAKVGKALVGTAMGGYDGHRGWVYALAVVPSLRRRGIAKALMAAVESTLRARGCVKLNLQVRASNAQVVAFYESIGFKAEDRISMGKLLAGPGLED